MTATTLLAVGLVGATQWKLLSAFGEQAFEFLAALCVIALLFHIGPESQVRAVIQRQHEASLIWVGDVLVNLRLGYLAACFLIGWALILSLFVAIGPTATSVGTSACTVIVTPLLLRTLFA
jgi:Kef-type K+ transport system membrane component KefB